MFTENVFTHCDFNFRVQYGEKNNSITFDATHKTQFLQWSTTITSNLTENTSEHIKVIFTPAILNKIFTNYCRGTLSKCYKIVLPEGYKHEDVPLLIEIHSTMDDLDEWDIKIITLEPMNVSVERRFELKLEQRDKQIEELNTKIENLNDKINELEEIYNDDNNICRVNEQIAKNNVYFLTKKIDDLCKRVDNTYTKEECDKNYTKTYNTYTKRECDVKYARKLMRHVGEDMSDDVDDVDRNFNEYLRKV